MSSADNHDDRFAPPRAAVQDIHDPAGGVLLATRGRRLAAAIVDVLVQLALMGALALVTPWNLFEDDGQGYLSFSLWEPALGFLLFLLANGYLLMAQGQTIGKYLLGLRIVERDGSAVPPVRLIGLRYGVFFALNAVPLIGQLANLIDALCIFRSSRRCLHDDLADTIVIAA